MKSFIALFVLALGLAFPVLAADQEGRDHLENRVKQLNSLAAKPGQLDLAIQRISTETGVPEASLRRQHGRHPDIGVGGLMIANVLANDTKKAPETFLKERAAGKKWLAIAKENKVSVETLNERLDRLARAIKGDKES
jgi:hypothetical protein